MGLDNFLVAGG